MKYSESFKAKMVQKMATGRSASSLSPEVGVSRRYRGGCEMRVDWSRAFKAIAPSSDDDPGVT
jgi:hypothetical protein